MGHFYLPVGGRWAAVDCCLTYRWINQVRQGAKNIQQISCVKTSTDNHTALTKCCDFLWSLDLHAQKDQGSVLDVLILAWLSLRIVLVRSFFSRHLIKTCKYQPVCPGMSPWISQTVYYAIAVSQHDNVTSQLCPWILHFFLWCFNNTIFPLLLTEICCERHSTAAVWYYGTHWFMFTHW